MDLVEVFARIGVEGARWVEEHLDEQFFALSHLWRNIGNREMFVPLVVANALVSYQLSGRGEDWWWEFAHWFSDKDVNDVFEAFRAFLPESRNNRRLVGRKLERIWRAREFLMSMDVERYYVDMVAFWRDLARVLSAEPRVKTVVFAVKMFGYAMRVAGKPFRPYPMEIPIPVDRRIATITARLSDEDPITFWNRVARASGVPPLHIDSVLWVLWDPEKRSLFAKRFGDDLIALLFPHPRGALPRGEELL